MNKTNRVLHKSYEQLEDRIARAEEIQLYTEGLQLDPLNRR